VGDQVQQGEAVQSQGALHEHQAHLRHRRPGEQYLDADAGHGDQGRGDAGQARDDEQQPVGDRRLGISGASMISRKPPRLIDAGVQQRGHGRRRLDHLDQPAVHRELGALDHGRAGDEQRGELLR
jgi:hypothetical protein